MRSKPPFRLDHVGSLVRPRAIVDARHTANLEGKLPDAELRALEDQAIEELIALQERVGLQAITDGESAQQLARSIFRACSTRLQQRKRRKARLYLRTLQASNIGACPFRSS